MSYLVWPATLPKPERDTWQAQPQDGRMKRQGDVGPPQWRRRFSATATIITMSLLLTRSQKAVFDAFYRDVSKGAGLFTMPDPVTDGWHMLDDAGAPVLTASGQPVLMSATLLCSFGDQLPIETLQGIEFRKTFQIVVMP